MLVHPLAGRQLMLFLRWRPLLRLWFWGLVDPDSAVRLSNATHAPGTPWNQIWEKYQNQGGIPKNTIIPDEMLQEYFSALATEKAATS